MGRKKKDLITDPIGISIDAFEEEFFLEHSNLSSEHPTPEQLMLRQAVKRLTSKQLQIWDMWNFERLTQDEIAKFLGITQQVVAKHIKAIETKIAKYCHQRMEVYKILKEHEEAKAELRHHRKVQDYHDRDSKY